MSRASSRHFELNLQVETGVINKTYSPVSFSEVELSLTLLNPPKMTSF